MIVGFKLINGMIVAGRLFSSFLRRMRSFLTVNGLCLLSGCLLYMRVNLTKKAVKIIMCSR